MQNPINIGYVITDESRIQDLATRWSVEKLEAAIAKIEAMKPHMQKTRVDEIRRFRAALAIKAGA
jgi:hypothetical protein